MPEKKYIGVQWDTKIQQWRSMIRHNGKTFNCGLHKEQKDAVKARDTMILKHGLKLALQILKPLKKK